MKGRMGSPRHSCHRLPDKKDLIRCCHVSSMAYRYLVLTTAGLRMQLHGGKAARGRRGEEGV